MKKPNKKLIIFLLTSLLLTSCAYYNTFYNTQKYYKEALAEQKKRKGDKPSSVEKQKFDKTIKQASKVLQLYPDSKYIDDSLMILGESFYYVQEYHKAVRKFQELLQLFPKSKFVEKARLWLAKAQIQLKEYGQAEIELRTLLDKGKNKSIRQESQYWLAEIFWAQKKYAEAIPEYEKAAKKLKNDELKFNAFMRLGECYRQLKNFTAEAESFRLAGKQAKEPEMRFQADLAYGRALSSAGKLQDAIRIFSNIIEVHFQNREIGLAKLELANALRQNGDEKKAKDWYEAIIKSHPRTAAAAGAYLALGKYEETVNHDYKAAEAHYQNARKQDNKSDYAKEAAQKATDIQKLLRFQKEISRLTQEIEKLKSTRLAASQKALDTTKVAGGQVGKEKSAQKITKKTSQMPDSVFSQQVDSLKIKIAKNKIEIAELFLFRFKKPDSAMAQYLDILSLTEDHNLRALAFYSLAYIFDEQKAGLTMRDSLLQLLALKYPDTPQGHQAAIRLGLPTTEKKLSPEEKIFNVAEENLLKNRNPRAAIKSLEWILKNAREEEWKARALFTLGWAYENRIGNNKRAYEEYKALMENYARTKYALKVRKKVKAFEQALKKTESPKDTSAVVASAATSGQDSLQRTRKALAKEKQIVKKFVEGEDESKVSPADSSQGKGKPLLEAERKEIEQLKKKYQRPKPPAGKKSIPKVKYPNSKRSKKDSTKSRPIQ